MKSSSCRHSTTAARVLRSELRAAEATSRQAVRLTDAALVAEEQGFELPEHVVVLVLVVVVERRLRTSARSQRQDRLEGREKRSTHQAMQAAVGEHVRKEVELLDDVVSDELVVLVELVRIDVVEHADLEPSVHGGAPVARVGAARRVTSHLVDQVLDAAEGLRTRETGQSYTQRAGTQ